MRDISETWPANWPILLERAALALLLLAVCVPRARILGLDQPGADRAAAAVLAELQGDPVETSAPGQRLAVRAVLAMTEESAAAAVALQVLGLIAHLGAAAALAWLLYMTHGAAAALFALALWGTLPVALFHGTLWGPENLGLACGLFGAGLGLDALRRGGALTWMCLIGAALVGAACGWTCAVLLVAVTAAAGTQANWTAPHRRLAGLALVCLVLTAALNAAWWPGRGVARLGNTPVGAFGAMALVVGLIGAGLRALRYRAADIRERIDRYGVGPAPSLDLVLPLLVAGGVAWHLEGRSSLVLFTPALAAAGAAAFMQLARPLLRLRAGLAPVVAAVGLVAFPGLASFERLRGEHAHSWSQAAESPSRDLVSVTRP